MSQFTASRSGWVKALVGTGHGTSHPDFHSPSMLPLPSPVSPCSEFHFLIESHSEISPF